MTGLRRWRTLCGISLALVICAGSVAASVATAGAAAAATSPSCTFNGGTFPIVTGVTPGSTVQVDCTGLPAYHPYLLLETSLVIAIDPSTSALLSGTVSPSLLIAVLSALPQINPAALDVTVSDGSGNLSVAYKTPTTQPLDPNASCPPSTEEFNSGLIGCALALVDLTTATEVGAGSALLEYSGFPLFPPNPTMAVSPKRVGVGQAVTVSDKPGATTYWWLATLADLEGDLGGSPPPPPSVTVGFTKSTASAVNNITIAPASYNGFTFTPPVLSGTFTVPSSLSPGKHGAFVTYSASLEGFDLDIGAHKRIVVSG
jgi:hypothetical protein